MNCVLNTGLKTWNNLPKYIKCSETLGQFKKKNMSLLTHEYPSSTLGVTYYFLTGQNKSHASVSSCVCCFDGKYIGLN